MGRTAQLSRLLVGLVASVCLLSALASAQTFPPTTTTVPTSGDITSAGSSAKNPFSFNPFAPVSGNSVSSIVAAVLNIVIGVLFTFFGVRLFRIVLFLGGAYFFALIAFTVLINVEPEGGFNISISREALYAIVMALAGLVGGFLCICLWQVGLVLLGMVGGFYLAVFIQSLRPGGLIPSQVGMWVFIGVFVIAGGIAAYMLENHIVIITTAITGSYSLFMGIDSFAKTGFAQLVGGFVNNGISNSQYALDGKLIGMLAGFAVTAILGIVVQYMIHGHRNHGVNSMKRGGRTAPMYGYAPVGSEPKVVVVR